MRLLRRHYSQVLSSRARVNPASGKAYTHQVFTNDDATWDATLNQTDVKDNKNKFFNLQVLQSFADTSKCYLFTHWGRVGERGQTQLKGPWSKDEAVDAFKSRFRSKAGVAWEDRVGMVAKKGKYTWLERDYDNEDAADSNDGKVEQKKAAEDKSKPSIPQSTLAPEIQPGASCCNSPNTYTDPFYSIIDATLSALNYDANKLPLGKLAQSTILKGFAALKSLSEVIDGTDTAKIQEYGNQQAACEELTNLYYSIIPHSFGRSRPIIINNTMLLKRELDLVDALGEMEIASKLMSEIEAKESTINPLDLQFRSLDLTKMEVLLDGSQEFKIIEQYMQDTHDHTHTHISAKIKAAFRVERAVETEAWKKAGFHQIKPGQRLLLWHGSRSTNFAGILKQGLRIAPPEAPSTGYMFGKGVYFADMMSKSAGYCHSSLSNGLGCLLLCEVAAKPLYELRDGQYNADMNCKKYNKRATKGIGRTQHQKWKDAGKALGVDDLLGCNMPDGKAMDVGKQGYLQYNEYIVYDVSQIRVRYLLRKRMYVHVEVFHNSYRYQGKA
ncbi:poly-ribose polymerase, partial [Moniliophthora roreri]